MVRSTVEKKVNVMVPIFFWVNRESFPVVRWMVKSGRDLTTFQCLHRAFNTTRLRRLSNVDTKTIFIDFSMLFIFSFQFSFFGELMKIKMVLMSNKRRGTLCCKVISALFLVPAFVFGILITSLVEEGAGICASRVFFFFA